MKITLICTLFYFGLITINFGYEEISDFSNKIGWKNQLESYTGCCVSLNQCADACCFNPFCSSFFYNDNDARCQLHSDVLNDTSFTVTSSGSRYYKCQKGKKMMKACPYLYLQLYCNGFGGNLAEPRSKDEYLYILRLLFRLHGTSLKDSFLYFIAYQGQAFWLGGRDNEIEGLWQWDSDNKEINFTAWGNGQPDNYGNEDYLCLALLSNFKWNDCPRLGYFDFICQMKYEASQKKTISNN
ncbi:hypothetical protein KUTeg_007333 [Tegillarca granosa]|uniref:C-type lectin domain-containing protein n=1 Tax=Tegillarca granosa TaxID=220873 RepID=A0ABQ9FCY7_TEGGR|nr:hypothetical protein KUTeg_007333 [Tegillarca granosa]